MGLRVYDDSQDTKVTKDPLMVRLDPTIGKTTSWKSKERPGLTVYYQLDVSWQIRTHANTSSIFEIFETPGSDWHEVDKS
ncbi:hypothetical protein PsorP6_012139 [Peronosclerospora sorghi]|uniref:Uncharacterized protein n=1 Tax=Peronosclerospora sorghi TaxID=230839 RepID=A0ACC0WJV3_9STRA|nr:hypothetical protein PsorP6_012139 [Peronosclerospora sorghi]